MAQEPGERGPSRFAAAGTRRFDPRESLAMPSPRIHTQGQEEGDGMKRNPFAVPTILLLSTLVAAGA